ncbi:Hpt domain-containing protein [Marinobacter salicampi]|uniref:hybrid sensor histidine kinase/response regulator n=1 Tax=Marinobacter salicampi TaxID=435907 RepID=UPI00140AA42C|nr:Hpt domain-containing protein [Marinobacter salicampi]
MGNHHDSIALDWVRGEIQETLTQGQHALEAFVDNRDDTARLRFCLNYLHQVHGTLQMVELYGAALLTEEMEKLTQAVLNDTVASVDEAVEVLMQAILQLPQYLEHLASSKDDFPLVLLPLLNDLRAARGESLLSDTSLFKPDLSAARMPAAPNASQRLQDPKVLGHIRKLRQMYQFALAGVVRETDLDAHFDYLHKVILRLIKLCQHTPRAELWRAAGGFVDSIKSGHNPINAAVKSILRELDNELRRLIDEHVDILQQPLPEALFKHLLYYVARAQDLDTPYVRQLTERYKLAEALPSDEAMDQVRDRVSGPGRDAIHSVVSALNEELAKLKDQLDLFVRAEFRQNSELEELLPGLQQVANTLAVLGLGIPRRVATEQIDIVEQLVRQPNAVDDGALMDIAGALLYIEATLVGLEKEKPSERGRSDGGVDLGSQELGEANSALLRESRNSLEQVKTAVVNFIASQWDEREIEHVPGLLHSIRGGLRLIPLDRVADMLASSERYITDVLLEGKRVPDWKQLDTLADTITSIEYYLERLAEGIDDNEAILQIAEQSLESLGFPVGAEPTWDGSFNEPGSADSEPEVVVPMARAADTDLVDDEILEIFIEEAEEVLGTINTYYPVLRQHHNDHEALSEVRRAYHTLKGSGRLVGATSIGEMAWAVENLLNRVIDQTIKPTEELFDLIDDANARIPALIEDFRRGNAEGDVESLIDRAEALATTRKSGTEAAIRVEADEESESSEEAVADASAAVPEALAGPRFDADNLIDDEILEIFVEEAGEVLDTIREYLPLLVRQYDDRTALAEIRRAFHTLKGSGRMVGATIIGELAWCVENMLNRIIDGSVFMNDDVAGLLQDVTDNLPALVSDFEHHRPASIDTSALEARATALANGEIPDTRAMPLETADHTDNESLVDPVLIEIFESETETHLQTLQAFLSEAGDKSSVAFTDNLSRALHTLKGSAHTAGIEPIARVITPLEKFVKDARAENKKADRELLSIIADACEFLTQGLAQIRSNPQAELAGSGDFLARLDNLAGRTLGSRIAAGTETDTTAQADPQLIDLFLNEGLDILLDAESILDAWAADPDQTEKLDTLVHELKQLATGARQSGITDVAELADILHQVYESTQDAATTPDASFFLTTKEAHETLINMMDQVAAGLATRPDPSLITELVALRNNGGRPSVDAFEEEFSGDLDQIDESFASDLGIPEQDIATLEVEDSEDVSKDDALDEELAEIFLEEASDLIESTADTLQAWHEKPDSLDLLRLLQRDLHTLKGGARLADIPPIGDLAHELETLFEGLTEHRLVVTDELSDLLFRCHDRLASMVDSLQAGESPRPAPDLIGEVHNYITSTPGQRPVTNVDDLQDQESNADDDELPVIELEADDEPVPEPVAEEPVDEFELDPELAEIFLEEAGEIIHKTAQQLHEWQADPNQPELVKELQRELHTLKGGARMANITPVADIAHEMETLFERIVNGDIAATGPRTDVALRAHDQLAALIDAIADQKVCPEVPGLVAELQAASSDAPTSMDSEEPSLEEEPTEERQEEPVGEEENSPDEQSSAQGSAPDGTVADLSHLDPELLGIFLEEAYDLINSTGSALHAWSEDPENTELAATLQRDVHTLKGGARMAGVSAIGDLTHVLEDLFEKVAEGQLAPSPAMNELLFACHDRLAQMVEQIATQKPCPPANELVAEVEAIVSGPVGLSSAEPEADEHDILAALPEGSDNDLIGIFLDEGLELHGAIAECLDQWREAPNELTGVTQLQQELHTLKGGARLADVDAVADLAEAWHDNLEPLIDGTGDQQRLLALSAQALETLGQMLGALEEGQKPAPAHTLIAAFHSADLDNASRQLSPSMPVNIEAVDEEVLEIFLEEASELLDQLEQLLADWRKEPDNDHFNREAQRALHTLKGGARLSQQEELGNQAHALETRLVELENQAPDEAQWQAITADHDAIIKQVAQLRERFEAGGTAVSKAGPAPEAKAPAVPEPKALPVAETRPKATPPAKTPKPKAVARQAEASRNAQETIRVSAPLLDELVNLAGETSITRGRLETQTSEFGHTLDEMAATIERLREQLRRMDIETEAQILFRAEREHGPDYGDDFDPLEMDRYSSIQQLSRALTESSSDLADLRETMADRVRDTETLLVQQSRINTELQEGLMKTRMIPFASMVPRLRRIVRQISGELGKKVEFDVRNAEGEMDRTILERMIAPLEHMLRNALDHGVEKPADRKKAGKSETGEVTLSLSREGGEVVLRMADDGAGIPTKIIRDKAIRQGMMGADEELSDREILQFILQPGFSTAQQVTQISGRGVGMDVVASEIKQLGGSLDIDSVLGQGTTFTVRLPFTVSVNRALMVSTGEDFYAIPLNTIEGIVRVSTYELEEYYQPDAPLYEYAGQQYRLQYLGNLLHSEHHPKLQGQALPLPVILVRGAEQPMALQVDSLMGSREIVVKSLGPQFTSVRGVSGATILGDGNVVVILDLPAMIRSDILSERQRLAEQQGTQELQRREARQTLVMVVDDSVTVRKVTSRLLERNGMEVITAKDGLDAVAQLQDHKPDIILLDIEMPRMDGFEVASFVRHDDSLRETPICMITSRTGQKHRERALAIGVNEYLGKPFQETELLETIQRLTGNT